MAEKREDYGKNPLNTGYFWKLDGTDKDVRYRDKFPKLFSMICFVALFNIDILL